MMIIEIIPDIKSFVIGFISGLFFVLFLMCFFDIITLGKYYDNYIKRRNNERK